MFAKNEIPALAGGINDTIYACPCEDDEIATCLCLSDDAANSENYLCLPLWSTVQIFDLGNSAHVKTSNECFLARIVNVDG